jgi:hypothetical protein
VTDDAKQQTYDPRSIAGTKQGELIADKLAEGEAVRCWFMGMDEPSGCLMVIPIVGTFLEFKKRFYLVVLTNQRLLMVELAKPFFQVKEKATTDCRLAELSSVSVDKGVLTSTVTMGLSGGNTLVLKSVESEAARAFDSMIKAGAGS